MRRFWCGVMLALLASLTARGDDPVAGEAVVIDAEGKEHKLTGLKFTTGTRRVAWLADPEGATDDEKKGPLALEVREADSTTFTKGVITLIPIASLEAARFDYEKKVATLNVKGLKEPLSGTLEYRGINVIGIGGMSDGKSAAFSGGTITKTSVKSMRFGGAQPLPKPNAGMTWNIQIVHPKADNPTLRARNLKVLYSFPGGAEELVEGIPVRKGQPIPFNGALKRFEMLASDSNTNIAAAEIDGAGGPERVIAIPLTIEQEKRTGTLIGFVGEVDAGWKLFPLHTIKVIKPSMRKIE